MADIYVVQKGLDVFIGILVEVGENGIRLSGARRVLGGDPFSIACLPPDNSELGSVSKIVDDLFIYRPDLLLKPLPSTAYHLRSICKERSAL